MSDLKATLTRIIADWKAKQNKTSFECGVQLETELAHFPLDEIDVMVNELDKANRLLRDVAIAFGNECILPYDSTKSIALRAINVHLKNSMIVDLSSLPWAQRLMVFKRLLGINGVSIWLIDSKGK